jgi:GDSL-like Lipase/Acylhydrolase family
MQHIVLIGDSIIDNAPYVMAGHTVTDYLTRKIDDSIKITRLARDGDVTEGAMEQLSRLPEDCTDIVISVGGNDALKYSSVLNSKVNTVAEAMDAFACIKEEFKFNYLCVLNEALDNENINVVVMTIYNNVPGLPDAERTALALFNEVILDVALGLGLKVIDLRHVCHLEEHYSPVSPIEPSEDGGDAITDVLINALELPCNSAKRKTMARVYS